MTTAPGVTSAAQDGETLLVEVGSGDYTFSYPAAAAGRVAAAALISELP